MIRTTEAIVLRNRSYLEADLIVSYLTKDMGVVDAFAKSPRKINSRFGSSLEPLTYTRVSLYGKEQANLPKIIRSDIIRPFSKLRESIHTYLKLSELLELTLHTTSVNEQAQDTFNLLLNVLLLLEDNFCPLYLVYYKIKLLEYRGFAPLIDSCVRCGQRADAFYLSHGATLCKKCALKTERFIEIEAPVYNLYRYLTQIEPSILKRVKVKEDMIAALEEIIDAHVSYNVVDRINSKEFMKLHYTTGVS